MFFPGFFVKGDPYFPVLAETAWTHESVLWSYEVCSRQGTGRPPNHVVITNRRHCVNR